MINAIDIIISVVYIITIVFIWIRLGSTKRGKTADEYFLAGKSLK